MTNNRRSIRLKDYDYLQNGAYFVTICTQNRECLFGNIVNGEMVVNEWGEIVVVTWNDLPNHNYGIELDEFVVMPNHIHGIIMIVGAGSKPALNLGKSAHQFDQNNRAGLGDQGRAGLGPAPTGNGVKLSEIVRQLKTFSARRINQLRNTPGISVWQRNYYERIIRDDDELNRIREYIAHNPTQWEFDTENPAVTSPGNVVTNVELGLSTICRRLKLKATDGKRGA